MYTRKPCCARKTAWCCCKIQYVSKFTAHCAVLPAIALLLLDQELISYRYSSCSCCSCWGNLYKNAYGSVFSNGIGMKFCTIVPQVNTHQIMESDFQ